MRAKSLVFILSLLCVLICGMTASAQELQCRSGSGVWRAVGEAPVLDGVLCSLNGREYDFYRINFSEGKGYFSPAIPVTSGELRYLYSASKVLFYADDSSVYALEREHFKVIWHQPWANAVMMPQDPVDPMHIAIWSKTAEGSEIHLVHVGARIEEEMSAVLGSEMPLEVTWQSKRLVVVERDKFTYWPRPGITLPPPPDNHRAVPETPADWKRAPRVVELDGETRDGDYQLDENGFLLYKRNQKKLTYFRFYEDSWTTARLNSSASVQGIGGCEENAIGVIQDYNTIRLISKLGIYLQKRIEVKYWRLPNPLEKNVVLAQAGVVAVDGGSDNRILTLDTTDFTYKRLALITLDDPGNMTELRNNILTTVHHDGDDALIRWNARSGSKIDALSAQKLRDIDFGHIQRAFTVSEFDRYMILVNEHEQFVIYDLVNGELSQIYPFESQAWSKHPKAIESFPGGFAVHAPKSAVWDVYPSGRDAQKSKLDAASFNSVSKFSELQTPHEKWYGYCLDAEDCFIPTANPPEQARRVPTVSVLENSGSSAPTLISWFLAGFSLLAMFGVMMWRHGMGRRSLLKSDDSENELATTDIFDAKNRRYISDRDHRFFLATHWFSTPIFRVCLSILLGLGVGVAVALPYFYDDCVATFVSWVVVLALPVSAVTWIATSWTYWNRYYLLRFGALTEGKWLNCAQTNPSIIYEPVAGKTFELSRSQWSRVDFVPMVLFDPARPEFAIQYTGGCSHTVLQPGSLDAAPRPACAYDIVRLFGVALILAGVIAATQLLYQNAFPNPLSAWKLQSIEPASGETFTTACLAECRPDDEACHGQCHRRQLRHVLDQAGIALDNEPADTAAQFLDEQRKLVSEARNMILSDQLSCDERLKAIQEIEVWPENVAAAFWNTYSHPETFNVNGLAEIYRGIQSDISILRALCDEYGSCATHGAECPVPPACPGRISDLKPAVCAFQNAIDLPPFPTTEEASN